MTQRRFGSWLASTRDLQLAFGTDLDGLEDDRKEFADYLTWNYAALLEELGEMMHELPWAPWKADRGLLTPDKRERAVDEAVDVLHFLGNVLGALHVTDLELSDAYEAKQAINRGRLRSGRSVKTGKHVVDKAPGHFLKVPCRHPRDFGGMEHEFDLEARPFEITPDDL